MQNYIFTSSQQFEDNCLALPAHCRPTLNQIQEWNKLAAIQVRKEFASAAPKEFYAWIGIDPAPERYTMKELWDLALANFPYDNYIICVEQNTEAGIRPHIHAVAKVTNNTRPKKEITRLQKIFSIENQCIHYKIFGSNLLSQRMKYVRGEKTDEKADKVSQDILDRQIANIPNFLSVGML